MGSAAHPWLKQQPPVLLGVVHLPPLPGSPGWGAGGMDAVLDAARRDADRILEAGFDGLVIENFGDAPFFKDQVPAHTIAAMTRVATALAGPDRVVGVNVLRNDAAGALAIAGATGLDFIRVNVHVGAALTDQGIVEGRAAETLRIRASIAPNVAIMADVDVKHARPLAPGFDRGEAARETFVRGGADGLIVTGSSTGAPVAGEDLHEVREAVPEAPLWIGSGASRGSISGLLQTATGVIVGTSIKVDGHVRGPVDPDRARAFVTAAR